MAITAAIAVSTATPKTLQKVACICTITNGNASAVNLVSLVPTEVVSGGTKSTGMCQLGQPNIGPGMPIAIAASGTLKVAFDAVPMAPNVGTYGTNPFPSSAPGMPSGATPLPPECQPQSQAYDIGALLVTSDGSVVSATVATITATPVNF